MLTQPRLTSKPAPYILYPLIFILSLFLSLSWVSAKEEPKPNQQAWQINGIVAALGDGYDQVKGYAFDKLTEYDLNNLKTVGQKPEDFAKKAVDILKDKTVDADARTYAALALANIEQLNLNNVVVILDSVYYDSQSDFQLWRFFTYLLSGATDEVKTLLTWLGKPKSFPDKLTYHEGVKTLQVFLKAWEPTKDLKLLRDDLAKHIAEVAANKNVGWKLQDINLLQSHLSNLKTINSTNANAVQSVIDNL